MIDIELADSESPAGPARRRTESEAIQLFEPMIRVMPGSLSTSFDMKSESAILRAFKLRNYFQDT